MKSVSVKMGSGGFTKEEFIVTVVFVVGWWTIGCREHHSVTEAEFIKIEAILSVERRNTGNWPDDLSTLEGKYGSQVFLDPWGNPYALDVIRDGVYRITSAGQNGRFGDADDFSKVVFPLDGEQDAKSSSQD